MNLTSGWDFLRFWYAPKFWGGTPPHDIGHLDEMIKPHDSDQNTNQRLHKKDRWNHLVLGWGGVPPYNSEMTELTNRPPVRFPRTSRNGATRKLQTKEDHHLAAFFEI